MSEHMNAQGAQLQPKQRVVRQRSALVDNLKAVLIVLVVAGHFALEYLPGSDSATFVYIWIYLFHMPAFALASGLVIRDAQRSASRAVMALLPMYVGFSLLHVALRRLLVTDEWNWEILVVPGVHWYLLSLLAWRLLLPAVLRLRTPMVVCIVLSLLAGLFDRLDTTMSLSRTVVFLPFFLAGHYLGIHGLEQIKRTPKVLAAAGLLVVTAVAVWVYKHPQLETSSLAGSRSYAEADVSIAVGMAGRVAMIVATIAAVIMVVQLVPVRRIWGMTAIGERTMTIYLLHMYAVYAFRKELPNLEDTEWFAVAGVLATIATVAVLQLRLVDKAVNLYDSACRSVFGWLTVPARPADEHGAL